MALVIAIALMLAGLVLLIKGADWLILGAADLARLLGVPTIVVGLTVVAFGTSAPELAAGIGAALSGHPELNIGNVVGSNIANVGLILGVAALVCSVPVTASVVRKDVGIMILVSLVGVGVLIGGRVNRWEGLLLVAGIVTYLLWQYRAARAERGEAGDLIEKEVEDQLGTDGTPRRPLVCIVLVIVGILALTGGSALLVEGATRAATIMGVSEYIIGLLAVAFGTSVPELATSIRAVTRGESDLAVGNVIGSNVFNVLCVLGITSLITPISAPPGELLRDLAVMLAMALACIPILGRGGKISRGEGVLLVSAYLGYVLWVALSGGGGSA